jgi:hypothetical protein
MPSLPRIALLCVTALTAGLAAAPPARAEVALGAKVGTLGAGVELTAGLSPQWNARLGLQGGSYTDRREVSDIEYDATLDLRSASAILDWHPGGRGLRLSAGVLYNATEIEGRSLLPRSGFYDLGGVPVPASQVGTLSAEADFDPLAPYAGLGWGNALGEGGRVRFVLDLGVVFQGQADVTLRANLPPGSPLNQPVARAALDILLEREARDLERDAEDYDLYPVAALGISYRF